MRQAEASAPAVVSSWAAARLARLARLTTPRTTTAYSKKPGACRLSDPRAVEGIAGRALARKVAVQPYDAQSAVLALVLRAQGPPWEVQSFLGTRASQEGGHRARARLRWQWCSQQGVGAVTLARAVWREIGWQPSPPSWEGNRLTRTTVR